MNLQNIAKIFDFINAVNKLKYEMRFKSNWRNVDSVAEHSWRLTLLAYLAAKELNIGLDVDKCVKIAIVHDLPEARTGDLAWSDAFNDKDRRAAKEENEVMAMKDLTAILPRHLEGEIYELWKEYRDAATKEAKFVKIMDKLEAAEQVLFMGFDAKKLESTEAFAHLTMKGFGWFPETDKVINFVREKIKAEFIKNEIEWKPEWDLK